MHQWNFPESIIAAVSTHHTPATAPNRPKRLAALAYAGNILAYRIGLGYGFPQYAALPEPACLRLIDLTPDGLEEYENEVLHSFQREQERFV
ncbi:MAG TPA: hypothetical protein VGR78_16380 [Verrucomicrobiae bacterium]|nr:hypothetical protein [Verrucomicrobiae bacterium]